MGQIIKVKVRPGGSVQFPNFCAHCSQPAIERMAIRLRDGRRTRIIDVPLCSNCHREVGKESGEEERLHRLGRVVTIITSLMIAILTFILLGRALPPVVKVLLALFLGIIVGAILIAYFRRLRAEAATPEKKAVLRSARLREFSWRATTFEFENEAFANRFVELNQEELMEV